MQPLLLHENAAWMTLAVLVGGWAAAEMALRLHARTLGAHGRAEWTLYLSVGSIAAATALAVPLAWLRATQLGAGYWPIAVGLALYAFGAALRLWAVLTLGRLFTLSVGVQAAHHVVANGPYHFVRHPSYSGVLIASLGLGIALANWLSIAVLALVPLPAALVRIRVEERNLLAALGEEYRGYARSRARLLPRIGNSR
jgi:protein-S-isoprenylcysteine O-methyltransferase